MKVYYTNLSTGHQVHGSTGSSIALLALVELPLSGHQTNTLGLFILILPFSREWPPIRAFGVGPKVLGPNLAMSQNALHVRQRAVPVVPPGSLFS